MGTFSSNIEAARDAISLLRDMLQVTRPTIREHNTGHDPATVRTDLRLQQVKALLVQKLKAAPGDPKPVADDAEMANLMDRSCSSSSSPRRFPLVVRIHWLAP